jgi:hypothetical protein
MELQINSKQTISDVQQSFRMRFPYLKIAFFRAAHQPGEGTPAQQMYDEQLRISDIASGVINDSLVITGDMKVYEAESLFMERYGLSAQVFRRSGDNWIQTTTTDNRTLNEQNEKGRELSEPFNDEQEPGDYQEQL